MSLSGDARRWRSRIGFGGLLAAGAGGVAYVTLFSLRALPWVGVLCGVTALVGIAGSIGSSRSTGWAFVLLGGVAVVAAGGRALTYGITDPLAFVLFLLGVVAIYRARQYQPTA